MAVVGAVEPGASVVDAVVERLVTRGDTSTQTSTEDA